MSYDQAKRPKLTEAGAEDMHDILSTSLGTRYSPSETKEYHAVGALGWTCIFDESPTQSQGSTGDQTTSSQLETSHSNPASEGTRSASQEASTGSTSGNRWSESDYSGWNWPKTFNFLSGFYSK